METVQFTDAVNFADALSSAGRINNSREMSRIIQELNEVDFDTSKSLMRSIKEYIDELDPFDTYSTITYVVDNIKDSHKSLIDPVHMIMKINKKRRLLQCFGEA